MTAALLSIGTELTRGELVNTNATWLAERLTALGFEVTSIDCCDDDLDRIVNHLDSLMQRSALIICTGGLGPTTDDMTTAAVAKLLKVGLFRDPASLEHIAERLRRFNRPMATNNAKQADFPIGAEVLPNPQGTAPGFVIRRGPAEAFFLPGVPREMKGIFEEQVVPRIAARAPQQHYQIKFSTFGEAESMIGQKLAGVEEAFPGVIIGYRAHFPEIEVKVLARGADPAAAKALAEAAAGEVRRRLSTVIYGEGSTSFVASVAARLREHQQTLGIAESCTGGLVASLLTSEPASDYFLLDIVTYANQAKQEQLGVPLALIAKEGAVSAAVAEAMARGVREHSHASIGLALTGIAGPTGGSEAKPVGLVYVGVATAAGVTTREFRFGGDRRMIQTVAAYSALAMVRQAAG